MSTEKSIKAILENMNDDYEIATSKGGAMSEKKAAMWRLCHTIEKFNAEYTPEKELPSPMSMSFIREYIDNSIASKVDTATAESVEEEFPEPEDVKYARQYAGKCRKSKERGINFELTFAQYKRLMKTKTCFFTGRKLQRAVEDQLHPDDLTLDRIDASVGYTFHNTVACCRAANMLKNHLFEQPGGLTRLTTSEFKRFAECIKSFEKKIKK